MKRLCLMLSLLLCALLLPAASFAQSGENELAACLNQRYPGFEEAAYDQWGNTAAAVFIHNGRKILCLMEQTNGQWQITVDNPNALDQDAPLPSLLLDSDQALYWSYSDYPSVTYSSLRETGGVWQMPTEEVISSAMEENIVELVFYQDGQIVHQWALEDKEGNEKSRAADKTFPAPWLEDMTTLQAFDLSRFPVLGYTEYDGEWPDNAFMAQAAAALMPEYTYLRGTFSGGYLRFLMQKPNGTKVFVGVDDDEGHLRLTESTPLPQDVGYGVENFTDSLGWQENAVCVSLKKYTVEDSRWGVSCMGFGDIFFGPRCVQGENSNKLYFGTHPWSDITRIDWSTLPKTEEEAVDCVNGSGYAMVHNPDPADRLHLRTEPTKSAASLGKYYTGTPVKVIRVQGDWVQAEILGRQGWMMKKYLDFSEPYTIDLTIFPGYDGVEWKKDPDVYQKPDENAGTIKAPNWMSTYVIGILEDGWYHIWNPWTDKSGFTKAVPVSRVG